MTKIILNWYNKNSQSKIISLLQQKQIVLGPSDTVLGLYAQVTQEGYVGLNKIKIRNEKPYLLLIGSEKEIENYTDQKKTLQIEKLIKACWPGPLTLIFKAHQDLPAFLKSQQNTIALRLPAHKQLQELLAEIPALFSTSANITGEPVPDTLEQVNPEILKQVACVIQETPEQQQTSTTPSTILDVSDTKTGIIKLVREGAYKREFLEKLLDQKI